jgi:hypothetical protein
VPRMADFSRWATAAEDALGWAPGTFLKSYRANRGEANDLALEIDPVADAVLKLMENRDHWTGNATQLWRALGEEVDEEVKQTKAWPAAPHTLTSHLRRLAPVLREVGIEYLEERKGHRRARIKTLRKMPEKERPRRPQGPQSQRDLQDEEIKRGRPADAPEDRGHSETDRMDAPTRRGHYVNASDHKERPHETPPDMGSEDDADTADTLLQDHLNAKNGPDHGVAFNRLLSDPPQWVRVQARKCLDEGRPERLLRPLASSIASEYLGGVHRWREALAFVEEKLEDLA